MKIKNTLLSIFLILISSFAFSQEFETGLLFDENQYNNLPQMPVPVSGMGFESVDLPASYSIKQYCPIPGNQGGIGSCVAWALGYGAQSIELAQKKGVTDRNQITRDAFSSMYIYNYVKVDANYPTCRGSYAENALNHVKTKGNVLLSDYNPNICSETPPYRLDEIAKKHKIKDWTSLFKTSDSKERKLDFIKNAIAQNKPVVICMRLTKTFYTTSGIWNPGDDPNPYGEHGRHAMVIVGYNDIERTFEIMNSWGTSWGNAGFIKIRYDDFLTYLDAAFQIVIDEQVGEKINLGGQFIFRYSVNLTGKPMGDATAYYNSSKNYYELTKKDWQLDQRFQLLVKTSVAGQYMYVFSINSQYKANTHFPLGKSYSGMGFENDDIDIVPQKLEFIIPEPERADNGTILKEKSFKISPVGTDYLVILYSVKSLKNELPTIIENTRAGILSGSLPRQALQNALGSRLISTSDISYQTNQVGFNASSYNGYVVPLIIRVDSK